MSSRTRWIFSLVAVALLLAPAALSKPEAGESKAAAAAEQTWPYETTDNVKVRSGPGTQYRVVAEIKSGTKVNVAASDGEWLKVVSKRGNPPGYIPERSARPTGAPITKKSFFAAGSYIATADTPVREGPGLRYRTVAKITKGMKVHVVDAEGNWLKVQSKHGNPPGYIEKRSAEHQQTN